MHPITLHLPVKDHGNECGLQGRTKPLPRVKQTSVQKRILWVFSFFFFSWGIVGLFLFSFIPLPNLLQRESYPPGRLSMALSGRYAVPTDACELT